MKLNRFTAVAVVILVASAAPATDQVSGTATFGNSRTELQLHLEKKMEPRPVCASPAECSSNFFLLNPTDPAMLLPHVIQVVETNPPSVNDVIAILDVPLADSADVVIVARNVTIQTKQGAKLMHATFSFNDRVRMTTTDAAFLRVDLDHPVPTPLPREISISVADSSREFERHVKTVVKDCADANCSALFVTLDNPLPSGDTVNVTVTFPGGDKATGKITTSPLPKSRDDATAYVSAHANLAQGAKDTYSYDVRIDKALYERPPGSAIALDSIHAILDSIAGSDKLKLADYGSFSTPFEFLVRPDHALTTMATILLAPEFRTDKTFANRDLGLNLLYSIRNGEHFDHSLERQRLQNPKSNPQFGWRFFVDLGGESGYHLASKQASVENTTFARAVAKPGVVLEHGRWMVTVATQLRYLFRKELAADSDGNVTDIRDGSRWFVRSELSRDIGFVSISIVNTSGRVPPLYKRARATVIGVTLKR